MAIKINSTTVIDDSRNLSNIANATNANTANTFVQRDASGNFSAGTITAAISGNATTATQWQTARTLTVGNTGKSINGTTNASWTVNEIGAVPSTGLTGAALIPAGTTAERPSGVIGYVRFNNSLSQFEGFNGSNWGTIGGGATGGGEDQVFVENSQIITTNYTITAGKNAMSTGPLTVNSGVVVTVPNSSTWVIL